MARGRPWNSAEDTAVRLAAALDREYAEGRDDRLRLLAARLGRTYAAVKTRASRLRNGAIRSHRQNPGGRRV